METTIIGYLGGCQNYGPFWGTLNIRCRTIIGTQKGTINLTASHLHQQCTGQGPAKAAYSFYFEL